MFNDKYGLTKAVLNGRKTMTRRIMKPQPTLVSTDGKIYNDSIPSRYKVGEIVAVAQPYKTFMSERELCERGLYTSAGVHNSMFVKSELMPHHIIITDIKLERLQDISEDDCMKEGIFQWGDPFHEDRVEDFGFFGATKHYLTAKEAFAELIDKVSGKGTWNRNQYVFAYNFEFLD
jgi:hypothetical protein